MEENLNSSIGVNPSKWRDPLVTVGIITALISAGVLIAISFSVKTMEETNKLTRMNIELSHRPYLSVQEFKIASRSQDTLLISPIVTNVGTVPANRVRAKWSTLGEFKDAPVKTRSEIPGHAIIFPQSKVEMELMIWGLKTTEVIKNQKELKFEFELSYQGLELQETPYNTRYEVTVKGTEVKWVFGDAN